MDEVKLESPNVVVVITARNSSERLPDKALVEYGSLHKTFPNLVWVYWRYKAATKVTRVIVATSTDSTDDVIESVCHEQGIDIYRGSLEDVTDRIYQAVKPYKPDLVFRGMADMPFVEPKMLDLAIDLIWNNAADYGGVVQGVDHEPVYGASQFPYSWDCVEQIWQESSGSQREHFGSLINERRQDFQMVYGYPPAAFARWFYRPYRLELDTQEDLSLVRRVYQKFEPTPRHVIPLVEVISYLDRAPQVAHLNRHIREKTGPLTSYDIKKRREWTIDQSKKAVTWIGDWSWLDKRNRLVMCNAGKCIVGTSNQHGDLVLLGGNTISHGDVACRCGAGRYWQVKRRHNGS